jgi:hypothetical protein
MHTMSHRFNAHKRAKKLAPGSYEALIKEVKIADNGDVRWSLILTQDKFEGVQITQRNVCSTDGGMSIFLQNLEILGIEGDWDEVQARLMDIVDHPVEVMVVHSEQLDRSGNPYINVYLNRNLASQVEVSSFTQ